VVVERMSGNIGGMIMTGETEVPGEKPHRTSVVDE
jgi:hypothetical protein